MSSRRLATFMLLRAHLSDHGLGGPPYCHARPGREQEHKRGTKQAADEHLWNGYVNLHNAYHLLSKSQHVLMLHCLI